MDGKCARYYMWCRLIDSYADIDKPARHNLKMAYATSQGLKNPADVKPTERDKKMSGYSVCNNTALTPVGTLCNGTTVSYLSLANMVWKPEAFEKKEEENMYTNTLSPEKAYLDRRVNEVYWDHYHDLPKLFGMEDDPAPKTLKQLRERLAAGLFVVTKRTDDSFDEEDDEDDCYYDRYNIDSYIRWRDPARKMDKEGLAKAKEELETAKTETRDIVMVKDADAGLAALQAFEAKTFH